jgi:hypothetical protein
MALILTGAANYRQFPLSVSFTPENIQAILTLIFMRNKQYYIGSHCIYDDCKLCDCDKLTS